jgi:hypothetical protein
MTVAVGFIPRLSAFNGPRRGATTEARHGTTATVKYPNQTNRHTPHPGPLPVEGRGEPDDAPRSSAISRPIHGPTPANASAGARRASLALGDASAAAPSPLNGERAGVRGENNRSRAKCRCGARSVRSQSREYSQISNTGVEGQVTANCSVFNLARTSCASTS